MKGKGAREKQLDYSKLPEELEGIIEPISYITQEEAKIVYDGKQFLVRFPKEIAKAMGIKKGDKIKFRVEQPSPRTKQKAKIEIEYVRSD